MAIIDATPMHHEHHNTTTAAANATAAPQPTHDTKRSKGMWGLGGGRRSSRRTSKHGARTGGRTGGGRGGIGGLFKNILKFFKETWVDWVTLVAVGILTGGLWVVHPTRVRRFPVTFLASGDVVYPDLAYPYVKPIFSAAVAGLVAALIPVAVILLCQIHPRIRSFRDASSAILGLAYSLAIGTCFQVILKKSIGGFRPHFLTVCEPVLPPRLGQGFQRIMYTSEVCTGNKAKIQNAMESFPSGHSNIAFAGLLYLAIYLNAHLRVLSFSAHAGTRRPRVWKMLAVVAPVLLATYLASTLVLGHHHHAYDVIMGALIGSVMAIWSYKMVFVSMWDAHTNCVPLRLKGLEGEHYSTGHDHAGRGQGLPTTEPYGQNGVNSGVTR